MRILAAVMIAVIHCGLTPTLSAQTVTPPAATGTLSGRVVDAQSGEPIRAATVIAAPTLFRGQTGTREAGNLSPLYRGVTKPDGTYEIRDIGSGLWLISVSSTDRHASTYFGQTSVDRIENGSADGVILQIPVRVRAGETTANVDLRVDRASSVSGRIFGANAQPVAGMEVELLRKPRRPGAAPLVVAFDQTDADGGFRVRVPPGEYYVRSYPSASTRPAGGGESAVYAPTFAPGVTDIAKAESIVVAPAQQLDDVAFIVSTTSSTTVEGRLEDAGGPSFSDALVELARVGLGSEGERPGVTADADGHFLIRDVTPGDYVVLVSDGKDPKRWVGVRQPLGVTGAVSGLRVQADRGSHVEVSVRLAANASPIPLFGRGVMFDYLAPTFRPSDGGRSNGAGTFSIDVPAGRVGIRTEWLPSPWFVESARLDGADVTNVAVDSKAGSRHRLEVVVSDRGGTLVGTVKDASNRPLAYAPIVIFPDDRARWPLSRLTRVVYSQQDGSFEAAGLSPGSYRIVGLNGLAADAWKDLAVLERLHSMAGALQVNSGQQQVSLEVTAAPADLVP